MKIPILILTKERPLMFRDTVEAVERYTDPSTYEIIICDNASEQPEMVDTLAEMEMRHTVIRNKTNALFEGLNPGLEIVKKRGVKNFIITDPDILITKTIPKNWPIQLIRLLESTNYPKVGLALNCFVEQKTPLDKYLYESEQAFWKMPVKQDVLPDPCYEALVDTYMAVYRLDTYDFWEDGSLCFDRLHGIVGGGWISLKNYNEKYRKNALRVAGRFMAEDLGSWRDPKYLPDLEYYYQNSKASTISSMLMSRLKLIDKTHGTKLYEKQ